MLILEEVWNFRVILFREAKRSTKLGILLNKHAYCSKTPRSEFRKFHKFL